MGDKSGITWTEASWNPVTGCDKVSTACRNCYAERDWGRLVHLPAYAGRAFTDVACHPERLDQPLCWKRPRRIFVNSMSDLFHDDVPDAFIDRVFAVMALSPRHTFQVLTKRSARMLRYFTHHFTRSKLSRVAAEFSGRNDSEGGGDVRVSDGLFPLPNVWIGVSIESQEAADERIPLLLRTPAAVRWISAEPLLGPVDLNAVALAGTTFSAIVMAGEESRIKGLDWVVVGGESGPKARPMHPDWARDLRDQCVAAGVPFFYKQAGLWRALEPGETVPAETLTRTQYGATFVKTRGGGSDLLDGRLWQEYPLAISGMDRST